MNELVIKALRPAGQPHGAGRPEILSPKTLPSEVQSTDVPGDAITVSVASTQPRDPAPAERSPALDELVQDIFSDRAALDAQSKLDPARVFELLNEDE